MRIVLAGGSGHIGSILARAYRARGERVTILSRAAQGLPGTEHVYWDGKRLGPWTQALNGADVVINLAGRSVNCRYNERNKREILASRIESTRILGEAIAGLPAPPAVWLQSSTATIYAHRFDAANDEETGILGGAEQGAPPSWRFSIDVATRWEGACAAARVPQTRKVLLRSAMVMSPGKGGVFVTLLRLVRCGLGGKSGDGRQYVSWIHERDFVAALDWIVEHREIAGVVNIAAPNPLQNAQFMREIRRAARDPFGLPAPAFALEAGAVLLGTETELLLKSRRVVPARLSATGFTFAFPHWAQAADDLVRQSS